MSWLRSLHRGRLHLAHQILPQSAFLRFRPLSRLFNYESLLGRAGLNDIRRLLDTIRPLPGDIVECGCHRCGTTVIMADYVRSHSLEKTIYACDSFAGFLPEELARERELGKTDVPQSMFAESGQYEYVREKIVCLGVEKQVVVVKGLFQESFPHWMRAWETRGLSFVFVDCDLGESILYCAHQLWPLLVPGGVMAFDDYNSENFKGANAAVDQFVAEKPAGLGSHRLMSRLYLLVKN